MEMIIDFPGGSRVDAHFDEFTIKTDQSPRGGGEGSAPEPFATFLASIGTCAGIYVLSFCSHRGLSAEGVRIIQRMNRNQLTRRIETIDLEIQVPPDFPKKYHKALIRSADQCAVKQYLQNPPGFNTFTKVVNGKE